MKKSEIQFELFDQEGYDVCVISCTAIPRKGDTILINDSERQFFVTDVSHYYNFKGTTQYSKIHVQGEEIK